MAGTASNPIPLNDETTGGEEDVETSKKDIKKNENEDGKDGNPGSGVEEDSDAADDDQPKKEGKSHRKDTEVKEGSASEKGATSGDLLSEEEPTSEGGSETVAEGGSGLTYPLLILGVLAILFAVVVALRPTATDAGHNYRSVEEFQAKINEMKSDFPQQYTVYFNMLANGGRKHLKKIYNEEKEDLTPQAYLIAGYAGALPTLECFVTRLADAFTDGYESLDSKDFAGSDEETKVELYKSIESKLSGSNKLLVVHGIDKLDFKVAQLFMSFADSHNTVANYPQSLILFTTELPLAIEFSGERVADEGEAGNHFRNVVWGDAHPDQSAPLWSRIGDGLLLIRGEEGILKC